MATRDPIREALAGIAELSDADRHALHAYAARNARGIRDAIKYEWPSRHGAEKRAARLELLADAARAVVNAQAALHAVLDRCAEAGDLAGGIVQAKLPAGVVLAEMVRREPEALDALESLADGAATAARAQRREKPATGRPPNAAAEILVCELASAWHLVTGAPPVVRPRAALHGAGPFVALALATLAAAGLKGSMRTIRGGLALGNETPRNRAK